MCLQAAADALLQAVKVRLTAQDQDQEVKECAVSCAAALVAQLGDVLQQDYSHLMKVNPSLSLPHSQIGYICHILII